MSLNDVLEERADRQKDDVKGEAKSGSRKEQANERTVISRNNRGSRQLQDELSLSLFSHRRGNDYFIPPDTWNINFRIKYKDGVTYPHNRCLIIYRKLDTRRDSRGWRRRERRSTLSRDRYAEYNVSFSTLSLSSSRLRFHPFREITGVKLGAERSNWRRTRRRAMTPPRLAQNFQYTDVASPKRLRQLESERVAGRW